MKKVNFENDEYVIAGDLSDIGNNEWDNIQELVRAITAKNDVLMRDVLPVPTQVISDVQIAAPDMAFAASGYLGAVPANNYTVLNPGNNQIGVFLKVTETPTTASRDKLISTPSGYAKTAQTVTIEKSITASVVITTSGGPAIPPPAPTLGVNDLGYILWATIIVTGSPTYAFSVVPNTTAAWSFPGSHITAAPHAAEHITGGSDIIDLADLSVPKSGLVTPENQYIGTIALTDIDIDPASLCFTRVLSGNNVTTPTLTPRKATLKMNINSSLEIFNDGGTFKLRVKYAGTGSLETAARSDHSHANLTTLPFRDVASDFSVTSSDLGTLKVLLISGTPANLRIYAMKAYWSPSGVSSPKIECGHFIVDNRSVGVKVTKVEPESQARIFLGEKAFVYLDTATLSYVTSAVGGSVTWSYDTYPSFPTSGKIYIEILLRENA